MIIDLEQIITGKKEEIFINSNIEIPITLLKTSSICSLKDVCFEGKIKSVYNLPLKLEGILKGTMILKDDITLEEVEYNFNTPVDEELENNELEQIIIDNKLDLLDIIWQLIQVEIPSKVHKDSTSPLLSGNGWKLISEDELNSNKNNAFRDLDQLLERKETK